MLLWRLRAGALGLIGAGAVMLTTDVPVAGTPTTEDEPAVAAMLRVLALEPLLVCRRPLEDGMEKPDPESRCCLPSGMMGISPPEAEALAELEDALDATEALCA